MPSHRKGVVHRGLSHINRMVRNCSITKAGRNQLASEKPNWKSITAAVEKVMEGA
jgi:hypothetical protein